MKIDFITINPSQYREHCFDLKGFTSSRWQVDFYLLNEDYEQGIDDVSDLHHQVALHFTAYDLSEETPECAYKFLQKALRTLNQCYLLENDRPVGNGAIYNVEIDYNTIFANELKTVLFFMFRMFGIKPEYNSSNIDQLATHVYLYYSSIKWLDYPFHSGCMDYEIFEDMESFDMLMKGEYELKEYMSDIIY